jgi:hypothetical protein
VCPPCPPPHHHIAAVAAEHLPFVAKGLKGVAASWPVNQVRVRHAAAACPCSMVAGPRGEDAREKGGGSQGAHRVRGCWRNARTALGAGSLRGRSVREPGYLAAEHQNPHPRPITFLLHSFVPRPELQISCSSSRGHHPPLSLSFCLWLARSNASLCLSSVCSLHSPSVSYTPRCAHRPRAGSDVPHPSAPAYPPAALFTPSRLHTFTSSDNLPPSSG